MLNSQYGSNAHMAYNGAVGYDLETTGVTATQVRHKRRHHRHDL